MRRPPSDPRPVPWANFARIVTLVLAGILLPMVDALAAAGLHQAPLPGDPAIRASFAGLSSIGLAAVVIGALLIVVSRFGGRREPARRTLELPGAMIGFFGASAMFLSTLPDAANVRGTSFSGLTVSGLLMAGFLLALVVSLRHGAARRIADWSGQRYGAPVSSALWLALLVVFIGVPIACAWSLAWNREMAGAPGAFFGLDSLFAPRYWNLGCVTGDVACGSAVNSILLGVVVSVVAGVVGLSLALFVHRSRRSIQRWMAVIVCLPMITPPFLVGLGLSQLFGQVGVISLLFESLFGVVRSRWFFGASGVMMVQVLVFFPIVYFMVLHALDSVSRTQIDAARFLGASDVEVLRTVSFPALVDSLAVALLIVFVETLSDIGTPLIVGGRLRVLSTELFYSSSMDLATGEMTGVPALLLTAIALGMAAIKGRFMAGTRRRLTVLPGTADMDSGHCELPLLLRAVLGTLLVATVLILVSAYVLLGVGAFSAGGVVSGAFTLENFSRAFGYAFEEGRLLLNGSAWPSLGASLSCAALVAPISGGIGMAMVWILQRGGMPRARWVESFSAYALSVPSLVIGAGFLLVFGHIGLSNLGAWLLILLAMVIRNLAVCMRFGGVALRRVDPAQSEVSELLGATSLTTFAGVLAPMLRSTFVVCVAYGFVRSMTMLGSVLLLSSADNQVATTYMIDRIGIGEHGVSMAYGVVLAGTIALTLAVGWAWVALRNAAPSLRSAFGDLKAAVVLAQKGS